MLVDLWRSQGGTGDPPRFSAAELLAQLGVYCYDYSSWHAFDLVIGPYKHRAVPADPVHVDQLPPQLRAAAQQFPFDTLRFAQDEQLQPLDFYRCNFRYKESRVAYLGADLRTVRPLPGLEARFREFCEEFRRRWPDVAEGLRFEGPPESGKDVTDGG
jgi:hypothetical protein